MGPGVEVCVGVTCCREELNDVSTLCEESDNWLVDSILADSKSLELYLSRRVIPRDEDVGMSYVLRPTKGAEACRPAGCPMCGDVF